MRVLFFTLIFHVICAAAHAQCDLQSYLEQPDYDKRYDLVRQGSECIDVIIEAYPSIDGAALRSDLLELLTVIEKRSERLKAFLNELLLAEDTSIEEAALLIFDALVQSPDSADSQERVRDFLSKGQKECIAWMNVPGAIFGVRGLMALEGLLTDAPTVNGDVSYCTATVIRKNFPNEAPAIIEAEFIKVYEAALTANSEDSQDLGSAAEGLLEMMEEGAARAFLTDILSVEDFPFDDANTLKFNLMMSHLDLPRPKLSAEYVSKIGPFFFNSYTVPQGDDESDIAATERRSRLLFFCVYIEKVWRHNQNNQRGLAQLIEENSAAIFSSDMIELPHCTSRYIAELDQPGSLILKLLESPNVQSVMYALQTITLIGEDRWPRYLESVSIKEHVLHNAHPVYAGGETEPVPRRVRLYAAAAYAHLTEAADGGLGVVLDALTDPDFDTRWAAIDHITQVEIRDDPRVLHALTQTLRQDPDVKIKTRILQEIFEPLYVEESRREKKRPYVDSYSLGIAILYTWNHHDEDLNSLALNALATYAVHSPHGEAVLEHALSSGNEAMKNASIQAMQVVIEHRTENLANLMTGIAGPYGPVEVSERTLRMLHEMVEAQREDKAPQANQ